MPRGLVIAEAAAADLRQWVAHVGDECHAGLAAVGHTYSGSSCHARTLADAATGSSSTRGELMPWRPSRWTCTQSWCWPRSHSNMYKRDMEGDIRLLQQIPSFSCQNQMHSMMGGGQQ